MPARFWAKVDQTGGPDACWPWLASVHKQGYGRFWPPPSGRAVQAHRLACELGHGPAPVGMDALHSCDTPLCCNPAHLRWDTHAENMRDRFRRGTDRAAKLCVDDVLAIRASDASNAELGAVYGVHRDTIGNIRRRDTWQFV